MHLTLRDELVDSWPPEESKEPGMRGRWHRTAAINCEVLFLPSRLTTTAVPLYHCHIIRPSCRSGLGSMCCCCRRRDLRKLEDRLWLRLHQLQEKENELHRQRTAILSRSLLPGASLWQNTFGVSSCFLDRFVAPIFYGIIDATPCFVTLIQAEKHNSVRGMSDLPCM